MIDSFGEIGPGAWCSPFGTGGLGPYLDRRADSVSAAEPRADRKKPGAGMSRAPGATGKGQ